MTKETCKFVGLFLKMLTYSDIYFQNALKRTLFLSIMKKNTEKEGCVSLKSKGFSDGFYEYDKGILRFRRVHP